MQPIRLTWLHSFRPDDLFRRLTNITFGAPILYTIMNREWDGIGACSNAKWIISLRTESCLSPLSCSGDGFVGNWIVTAITVKAAAMIQSHGIRCKEILLPWVSRLYADSNERRANLTTTLMPHKNHPSASKKPSKPANKASHHLVKPG